MGLTRPNAIQINTVATTISDPITVLNQGSTTANTDVGFILNRNPSNNVAFVWQESSDQFVFVNTNDTGSINANIAVSSYANIQASAISGTSSTITGDVIQGTVPVLTSSSITTGIGTSATAIDTFATATYRSAKYVISITDITNTQYQTVEMVLVQDGTTATISPYGVVWSGSANRMTFTASISSGTLTLYGTGVSANNTVKLVRTLIPV